MIKVFLFLFRGIVADTDHIPEIVIKQRFNHGSIPFRKCAAEGGNGFFIGSGCFLKPDADLIDKQSPDFLVGNHELVWIVTDSAFGCQISGSEKYTPQIFNALIQFIVSQFLVNVFGNGFPGNQVFHFVSGLCASHVNKSAHNGIAAGVQPVVLRRECGITQVICTIIDDIPWAVHIHISKMIAVIPGPDCFII